MKADLERTVDRTGMRHLIEPTAHDTGSLESLDVPGNCLEFLRHERVQEKRPRAARRPVIGAGVVVGADALVGLPEIEPARVPVVFVGAKPTTAEPPLW